MWCHRYGSCDAGWEGFGSVGIDLKGAIYSQGLQKRACEKLGRKVKAFLLLGEQEK